MGVGTEHRSHFAVQEIAHGELFTGRFGMEVDDDVFDRGGNFRQNPLDRLEGAVGRFAHEHLAQQRDDGNVAAGRIRGAVPAQAV